MSMSLLSPAARRDSSERATADHLPVSWATVAVLAIVIAYVDGFVQTSLHGAVGDVASTQGPFLRWLRDSTMMLPPLVLSVLAALALLRRWVHRSRSEIVRLAIAAVLIIGISTAVSIVGVAVNAASDYAIQSSEIAHAHGIHTTTVADQSVAVASSDGCVGVCAARHATLMAHIRGIGYASEVLVLSNLVLVVWVLAMRGGRIWSHAR